MELTQKNLELKIGAAYLLGLLEREIEAVYIGEGVDLVKGHRKTRYIFLSKNQEKDAIIRISLSEDKIVGENKIYSGLYSIHYFYKNNPLDKKQYEKLSKILMGEEL